MFRNRPKLTGTLLGCLVSLLLTIAFFYRSLATPLEMLAYDYRARHFSSVPASDRIVHVDIDNSSLDTIGRWPWPRDVLADLIRTLNELGAELICVDLLLSERQPEYFDHPSLGEDVDVDPPDGLLGDLSLRDVIGELPEFESAYDRLAEALQQSGSIILSEQNKVYGDLELADALSQSKVILAVETDVLTESRRSDPVHILATRWPGDRDAAPAAFLSSIGLEAAPENIVRVRNAQIAMKVADVLRSDFTLDQSALASQLNEKTDDIAAVIAGAKRDVARERVGALFRGEKTPPLEDVLRQILGDQADRLSHDRVDVNRAYRTALGMREVRRRLHAMDASLAAAIHDATNVVPPYFVLGRAALDLAAVKNLEEESTVRRVPIAVEIDGRLMPHMGLAAAAHALDLDLGRISMSTRKLMRIPKRDGGAIDVPLDGRGNMLIPWTKTGSLWRLNGDFPHIPAAKVFSIADARRALRDNERAALHVMSKVVAVTRGARLGADGELAGDVPGDRTYIEKVNRREELAIDLRLARLKGGASNDELVAMQAEHEKLDAEIRQTEKFALADVKRNCADLDSFTEEELREDPSLARSIEAYRYIQRVVENGLAVLQRNNERIRAAIDETIAQLTPVIRGKYVFFGYAATAEGDIVPTPIDPHTNGVMVHAYVLNAFLQNRFIALAPSSLLEVALCLFIGAVVSLVTATSAPRVALPATLIVLAAFAWLNAALLFGSRDLFYQLLPAVATGFFAWVGVTLFRQFTAERDRRMFIKQLSQYTAPAIAARIAESPAAAQAFKSVVTRDVTCFFSDLKGFTSISEREDPEVVQHVLNVYLKRMSQTIWDGRGLINKFMGDGIMAFFNPSVDPLPDHANIACETAVRTLDELALLVREEQNDKSAGPIFKQMEMRIGLACGLCKNGDMGSELKADYTVIGDVVNLAARLEPANKVFGTSILVSGPLRERVKDKFEFRYLAELQVKGKRQTVPVFELLGRKGDVPGEQLEYARRFEAGVELYKARKWDECIVHFMRMIVRRPDDAGASRYIEACQEMKTFPPGDDWNGALELKEK